MTQAQRIPVVCDGCRKDLLRQVDYSAEEPQTKTVRMWCDTSGCPSPIDETEEFVREEVWAHLNPGGYQNVGAVWAPKKP